MRLLISLCAVCGLATAGSPAYQISATDPGPWPAILSSVGLIPASGGPANLFIVRAGTSDPPQAWIQKIEAGAIVVLEGESDLANSLGFKAGPQHVLVRSIVDIHAPKLPIVWEKPVELRRFEIPKEAVVFATERWEGAPVVAAVRRGTGAALWIAASPGTQGYERFPYLLQALRDLGWKPPFESRRLWAFFDSAYRSRVDLDYFAARWRKSGIAALQVAAWHYFEPSPDSDDYLRRLIAACHRNGILVYAWLELPHVSEKFWADHPEWREKTAILQDAKLDWRKLINLDNRQSFAAVRTGVAALLDRFDWDGVNLAELYFESLEGAANPARFTPMNDDFRREFQAAKGFDPIGLFQSATPDPKQLRIFLDYRAGISRRRQIEWMDVIESVRAGKPDLDLVLTQVDDRFATGMRDSIGADAGRVLPLLDQRDFTYLIEDPATVWNLGPARYPEIARRYAPLTDRADKLAIDINIVERYQDVYPTKQQTGTELFQLVHLAAAAFPQVALYFENSILQPDLPLLAAAAASVDKVTQSGSKLTIESRFGVALPWQGPATVNGHPWPVRDAGELWLPAGVQTIEPGGKDTAVHILDFNGNLRTARADASGLDFSYQSNARAIAILDFQPKRAEIDGLELKLPPSNVLILPRGQHLVVVE
jgi:hypothetical protein